MTTQTDVYQVITDRVIEMLENGDAPWRKPWGSRRSGKGAQWPQNIEGKRYRGINVFLLLAMGYESPYWLTFNQCKQRGGHVRKGEKSTVVIFWKRLLVDEKDDSGKPTGRKITIPMAKYYRVFNIAQCDGVKLPRKVADAMAPVDDDQDDELEAIDAAEAIVAGFAGAPSIRFGGDRAFYQPLSDAITVPPLSAYQDAGGYYSTMFHELGHSTGHKSRLDRWKDGNRAQFSFGSHTYGREELVAEMTAAFLCAEAGIMHTHENSAAYLRSWIRTIREDVRAVVVAAGAAQRAADHILGRVWEDEKTDDEKTETVAAALAA